MTPNVCLHTVSVACSGGGGGSTTADPNACACLIDLTGKGYPPEVASSQCLDLVALDDTSKAGLATECTKIEAQCKGSMGTYTMGARCSTSSFLGRCKTQPTSGTQFELNRIIYADPSGK